MTDVAPATTDPFLTEKAAAIHRVIDHVRKCTREGVIEIGSHLAEVRAHVGEGNWLAWLEAEFGWSDQTARRCIHEYEAYRRDPALNIMLTDNLPMTAVYLLVAPNTPPEASKEVAERIESGEKLKTVDVQKIISRHKSADNIVRTPEAAQLTLRSFAPTVTISGLAAALAPIAPDEVDHDDDGDADHDDDDGDVDHDDADHDDDGDADHDGDADRDDDDGDADHMDEGDLTLWAFFFTASGGDIYEQIPADRRKEVCRAFLDKLTVAGMLEAMSAEFGRQLRARLPKRNEQDDAGPYSRGETDRLREKCALEIKIGALESEIEHLNEQLRDAVEPGLGEPAFEAAINMLRRLVRAGISLKTVEKAVDPADLWVVANYLLSAAYSIEKPKIEQLDFSEPLVPESPVVDADQQLTAANNGSQS